MLRHCQDKINNAPHLIIRRPRRTNRQWLVTDAGGNTLNHHNQANLGVDPRGPWVCGGLTGQGCGNPVPVVCNRAVCPPDNQHNRGNALAMMDWLAAGVCNLCADEIEQTMNPGDHQCAPNCPRRRWCHFATQLCERCCDEACHRDGQNNAERAAWFCQEWASNELLVPNPAHPNDHTNPISTRTRLRAAAGQPPARPNLWRRRRGFNPAAPQNSRNIPLCACGRGEANHLRSNVGGRRGAQFRRCMACFQPAAIAAGATQPGPRHIGVQQRFLYLPATRVPFGGGPAIPYWDVGALEQ